MAWAAAQSHLLPPSFHSHSHSKSPKIPSALSSLYFPPTPTKHNNRKNFLRPKLLELRKYSSPIEENPNPTNDIFPEIEEEEEEEKKELGDLRDDSMATVVSNSIFNRFVFGAPNSFLKIALYCFGIFVFHTVCAVWVLRSEDLDERSRGGNSTDGISKTAARSGIREIGNGNGSLSGSDFEQKVSEIRAMAKEARAIERKRSGDARASSSSLVEEGDGEIAGENSVSSIKDDVKKEVGRRLVKLQKSLRSNRQKSPKSSNSVARGGNSGFRKNSKWRIPSMKARNDPKGFGGKNFQSRSESDDKDLGLIDDNFQEKEEEEESRWLNDEILKEIVKKVQANEEAGKDPFVGFGSEEEINFFRALDRKFEREGESAKRWMEKKLEGIDFSNGGIWQSDQASPNAHGNVSGITTELIARSESAQGISVSGINNRSRFDEDFQKEPSTGERISHYNDQSSQNLQGTISSSEGLFFGTTQLRESEAQVSQSSTNGNQHTSAVSWKQTSRNSKGSSKMGKQTRNVEPKPDAENNFWWQNLPYVLAILLRRGSDRRSARGLYSLKLNSHSEDENSPSYTIAFEDRADATNFCYILESFFEDLGDFNADVFPLSIKELKEAMKSGSMKVIVIRKGQLQLYAGQPLEEVERALRSIPE